MKVLKRLTFVICIALFILIFYLIFFISLIFSLFTFVLFDFGIDDYMEILEQIENNICDKIHTLLEDE